MVFNKSKDRMSVEIIEACTFFRDILIMLWIKIKETTAFKLPLCCFVCKHLLLSVDILEPSVDAILES